MRVGEACEFQFTSLLFPHYLILCACTTSRTFSTSNFFLGVVRMSLYSPAYAESNFPFVCTTNEKFKLGRPGRSYVCIICMRICPCLSRLRNTQIIYYILYTQYLNISNSSHPLLSLNLLEKGFNLKYYKLDWFILQYCIVCRTA